MRYVRVVEAAPQGAIRVIGVLAGEPLEDLPARVDPAGLGFSGDAYQTLAVASDHGPVLLVGLGDQLDSDTLREACGEAARTAPTAELATSLHTLDLEGATRSVVEGFLLGSYRYHRYRNASGPEPGALYLVGPADAGSVAEAVETVRAVYQVRDWVNRPPVDKSPRHLADEMGELLDEAGLQVEIWDEDRIVAERLGGLLGVSAGSDRPPRMVVGRLPRDEGPSLALVGKGIVFDSGGLSIKPADMMETMKSDMAGAAAVVAAAAAVSRLGVEVGLSLFVPLTDNMSGGSAVKPGDILTTRNGKTIEVLNTDAEGRLVLADALALAVEESPDLIVDVATLTGAARVALGDRIAALFASDEEVRDRLLAACAAAGERAWPMPLPADYRKLIDSPIADMKNTGGRYGGAITAALLLAEFVGQVPWAHLDIAGPSYFREDAPLGPQGGSGYGAATLVALAQALGTR